MKFLLSTNSPDRKRTENIVDEINTALYNKDNNKINTKKMKFANNQIYHILVSLRAETQRQTKWCQLISEKLLAMCCLNK